MKAQTHDLPIEESTDGEEGVALLSETVERLEAQVQHLKEEVLRSQADYQNLLRRTKEERTQFVQFALKGCMEDIIEPLEHLTLTAEQLQNPVLSMVVTQLMNKLSEQGLQEITVMGKPFSLDTMEVVELTDAATEETGVVVKVVKRGYTLNGSVLQHAKVVIGSRS